MFVYVQDFTNMIISKLFFTIFGSRVRFSKTSSWMFDSLFSFSTSLFVTCWETFRTRCSLGLPSRISRSLGRVVRVVGPSGQRNLGTLRCHQAGLENPENGGLVGKINDKLRIFQPWSWWHQRVTKLLPEGFHPWVQTYGGRGWKWYCQPIERGTYVYLSWLDHLKKTWWISMWTTENQQQRCFLRNEQLFFRQRARGRTSQFLKTSFHRFINRIWNLGGLSFTILEFLPPGGHLVLPMWSRDATTIDNVNQHWVRRTLVTSSRCRSSSTSLRTQTPRSDTDHGYPKGWLNGMKMGCHFNCCWRFIYFKTRNFQFFIVFLSIHFYQVSGCFVKSFQW